MLSKKPTTPELMHLFVTVWYPAQSANLFLRIDLLKGLSVIVHSKLHFFPNAQIFCIFRENFTVIIYLCNNSLGKSIFFRKRENSLLLGINYCRWWLIQASVSSEKSFFFFFFWSFSVVFHLRQQYLLFFLI